MTSPTSSNPQLQRFLDESRTAEGQLDQQQFMQKINQALIDRGDTDAMLEEVARRCIAEIQANQSLVTTQKYFDTVEKMKGPKCKGAMLAEGFEAFSSKHDLQWIALQIAKKRPEYKDGYLYNLVEACLKTGNKEIATQAVEQISHEGRKAKYSFKVQSM